MAKTTAGIGGTRWSGKIGGVAQTKTKPAGQLVRSPQMMRQPTDSQRRISAMLSSAAREWRNLSEDQRKAWNNGARKLSKRERDGADQPWHGFNWFTSTTVHLLYTGRPSIGFPPAPLPIPVFTASIDATQFYSGILTITTATVSGGARTIVVAASRLLSAGVSRFQHFPVTGIAQIIGQGSANRIAQYQAVFGQTPTHGPAAQILFKMYAVSFIGNVSEVQYFLATVNPL